MECDHTSLNKFTGPDDKRYQHLINKLKKISACLTGVSPCGLSGCKGIQSHWRLSLGKDSEILFPENKQAESSSEIVITSSGSTIESLGHISINLFDSYRQKIFHMEIKVSDIIFETRADKGNCVEVHYPYIFNKVSTFRIRCFRDHYCICYDGQSYIKLIKGPQYDVASMEYTHSQSLVDVKKTIPGHLDVEYRYLMSITGMYPANLNMSLSPRSINRP